MIWAVVLAAGASTRMGRPKALLPARDGRSFVACVADCALAGGVDGVMVVTGPPHDAEILGELHNKNMHAHHKIMHAHNNAPERGMLSSVQAGVSQLPAEASAALVWPVDMPYVQPETVRQIAAQPAERIVVPEHAGRGGHPLRVPQSLFDELMALEPSRGLRALLQAHASRVTRIAVADAGVLLDVDTPEDYARARR